MATISEQDENDYITARLVGDGWFGATDTDVEGEWRWVTGPETGTLFWQGRGDGTLVDGQFANWDQGGEPNDYSTGEDCAQFYGDGRGWNDLPCEDFTLSSYVVEYGAPGDMPIVPSEVSVSTTTTTPAPASVTLSTCEQFFDEYVNSNEHRYDNITLTQNLDCEGEAVFALFSDTEYVYDEDEGEEVARPVAFRGTFNGNGHTISNLVIQPKDDSDEGYLPNGLFGATDTGVTIENLTLDGITVEGADCTGGIVGSARDLTLRNVHFNGNINLPDEYGDGVGGLVGCLKTNQAETLIEDSSFDGVLVGNSEYGDEVGGLIGKLTVESDGSASVSIAGSSVEGTLGGYSEVGGLIGHLIQYGDDTSISLADNTSVGPAAEGAYVGGIVGDVYISSGTLDVTRQTVTSSVSGGQGVGGIIGYMYSSGDVTIREISSTVDVTATSYYGGGIVGSAYQQSNTDVGIVISGVSSTGEVKAYSYAGGVVGYLYGYNNYDGDSPVAKAYQSYATGAVEATDSYYAGGLVGFARGAVVDQSYATGDVSVPDDETAGGLVGYMYLSVVQDSYARGDVVSQWGRSGGLVGDMDGDSSINNSYAIGSIDPIELEAYDVGGLVGRVAEDANNSISSSYWDTQTSGVTESAAGAGKSSAAMKIQSTFTGWDFDDVWATSLSQNDGYPCLQWVDECENSPDQDAVDDEIEGSAPNGGDGNGDGTQDGEQSNVTSVMSPVSGKYITLESTCASNYNVQVGGESSEVADAGYDYPAGLIGFVLQCGTPGTTATITQYYYGDYKIDNMVLRKKMNDGSYVTLTDAVLSKVTIGGQSAVKVVYSVTDGSVYDDDGVVDGNIVDPVGLAVAPVLAPNTGEKPFPMGAIVAALIGGVLLSTFGIVRIRRTLKERI